MKKVLCTLLVIALLLAAACAHASGTVLYRFTDAEMVNSMVSYDGKLIASDGLNSCVILDPSAGAENIEIPLESLIPVDTSYWYMNNNLVPADDGIYMIFYGINTESFETGVVDMNVVLARYALEDDALVIEEEWLPDWSPVIGTLGDYALHATVSNPCIVNGTLVGNVYPLEGPGYLLTADLSKNACTVTEAEFEVMCPYKDGKILTYYCDHTASDSPVIIKSFDPATGISEELCRIESRNYYGCSYCAYDEASDTLYFVTGSVLYSVSLSDANSLTAFGEIKVSAGLSNCAVTTEDGSYICSSGAAIYKYDAGLFDDTLTLWIVNNIGSVYYEGREDAEAAFSEAHPDVEIIEKYSNGITFDAAEADIYILDVSSNDYSYAMENGITASLSESPAIAGEVNAMYPWIRELAEQDGSVIAFPVHFTATTDFCYYPYGFEAAGLSEEDVPVTWMEFLKFLQDAPAIIAENDGMAVFPTKYGYNEVREEIFRSMIGGYIMHQHTTGQPIDFNTPLLRELIAEFEKIDFSALGMPEEGEWKIYGATEVLFTLRGEVSPYVNSYDGSESALPLAFDTETHAYIPAELYVAIISPDSENAELAMEYLEYAAASAPEMLRIYLSPDYNEPVLMEMYRDDTEGNFENDPFAWDASAESIAWYRSMADSIVVTTDFGINESNLYMIYDVVVRYLEGSLTAEEFLTEANRTLDMIVLEAR